jgi:CheY-like chemotaxis protein
VVPVIVINGHVSADVSQTALAGGAVAVVRKPYQLEDLQRALDRARATE